MAERRRFAVEIEGPAFNGLIWTRSQAEARALAFWLARSDGDKPDFVNHSISDTPWLGWSRRWRRALRWVRG
jgi:hypothetical protein